MRCEWCVFPDSTEILAIFCQISRTKSPLKEILFQLWRPLAGNKKSNSDWKKQELKKQKNEQCEEPAIGLCFVQPIRLFYQDHQVIYHNIANEPLKSISCSSCTRFWSWVFERNDCEFQLKTHTAPITISDPVFIKFPRLHSHPETVFRVTLYTFFPNILRWR